MAIPDGHCVGLIDNNSSGHERGERKHDGTSAEHRLPSRGNSGKEREHNKDVKWHAEEG